MNLDFIQYLGHDMSIEVFNHLNDPCDLVRASAVSRSWYQFVVTNGLCKKLCFKMLPEITDVVHSIEVDKEMLPETTDVAQSIEVDNGMLPETTDVIHSIEVNKEMLPEITDVVHSIEADNKILPEITDVVQSIEVDNITEPIRDSLDIRANCERLKGSHKVYAVLAYDLTLYVKNGIRNTIFESPINKATFSLTEGEIADVVESLTYKLCSNICLITKIRVQPFQGYFEDGSPKYSYSSIRFKIGHHKTEFVWTYTSADYTMLQENQLQELKLPEPALCIGGVLLVELSSRVQKRGPSYEMGVSLVQVEGLPISPAFDVKIHHGSGKYTLKYNFVKLSFLSRILSHLESLTSSITSRDAMLWMYYFVVGLLGLGSFMMSLKVSREYLDG